MGIVLGLQHDVALEECDCFTRLLGLKPAYVQSNSMPFGCPLSHRHPLVRRRNTMKAILCHAAGSAAAMACAKGAAVQDLDVTELQTLLLEQKQLIHP